MKNAKRDMWTGILFLALSLLYFAGSFSIATYSGYGNQTLDSKFMPRLLGILMALLSLIEIAVSWMKLKKHSGAPEDPAPGEAGAATASSVEDARKNFDEDAYVKGSSLKDILVVAALLLFYAATYKALGFILSSTVFLFCSIFFLTPKEKRSWFWLIILSVGVPFAVYFLFVSGFKMMLPSGILKL